MLCLAQYSRLVIPLAAYPSTIRRFSSLLPITPLCGPSPHSSRWVPQTLTVYRQGIERYTFWTANELAKTYGRVDRSHLCTDVNIGVIINTLFDPVLLGHTEILDIAGSI